MLHAGRKDERCSNQICWTPGVGEQAACSRAFDLQGQWNIRPAASTHIMSPGSAQHFISPSPGSPRHGVAIRLSAAVSFGVKLKSCTFRFSFWYVSECEFGI